MMSVLRCLEKKNVMVSDSQVWGEKSALWVVLTARGISTQRLLHAQVVLRSALPINLYFTNAIFAFWLPDNIP